MGGGIRHQKTNKNASTGQIRGHRAIYLNGQKLERIEDCPFVESCNACCTLVNHYCAQDDPKCRIKYGKRK